MAQEKLEDSASVKEVDVESATPVYEVVTEDEDGRGSDEWHASQAEALLEYKVTGRPGVYADPSRDQEPDIAPELGVSPHPELANPAPPATTYAAFPVDNYVTQPVEDKVEAAEEAEKEEEKAEKAEAKADAKAEKQAAKDAESSGVALSPGESVEVSAENA